MPSLSALYTLLLWHITLRSTFANVEKVVFLAPINTDLAHHNLLLEDIALDVISPSDPALHTHLPASFPSPDNPLGTASWFLLDGLQQHKRYELRICWAATVSNLMIDLYLCSKSLTLSNGLAINTLQQPTSFSIHSFSAVELLERPEVAKQITLYSQSRQTIVDRPIIPSAPTPSKGREPTSLFLRVDAAANYHTTNQTLMQAVAPVKVDLSAFDSHLIIVRGLIHPPQS